MASAKALSRDAAQQREAAQAATAAAKQAQQQLALAHDQLARAREEAQAQAQAQAQTRRNRHIHAEIGTHSMRRAEVAATAQSQQPRQRQPRQPPQRQPPQQHLRGVRSTFQDLETVLMEAGLFADSALRDLSNDELLPPLPTDFGDNPSEPFLFV